MPSDRRDLISDLYHGALARAPENRAAFLTEACKGDDALRQEVESLLEYESASARFLERPAVIDASIAPSMVNWQIGSYTIVAPLGAGGMGEVYRARDSKLGRDVAIKILPSHFTADPERRARFAREARLLATLNHPHIGAIYGLEEADGISALVLELVEGRTLADRLERGGLPISQALAIARQIAEALEAAHEKGIVHRDLKPANIVLQGSLDGLSADIRAKVLDFGLAKPIAQDVAAGPTQAPSDSFDGTADGRILGTPAYMSPEQARGLAIDKRSDIWAFGCVLFEMLSGRRPFEGKTITDTLVHVLEREPDWAALPSATPEAVRKLVRRCLVKDPSHRLRDIGDVQLELEDAGAAGGSTLVAAQRQSRLRSRPVLLATLGVLVLAAVMWAPMRSYLLRTPASVPQAPAAGPVRLTFDEGLQTDPTLSSDGRSLAYSSNREGNFDIYMQPVAGGNAVQVTRDPAHDWQPDWSVKDQIVFRSERDGGGLYVVASTGGHEQRVAAFGYEPLWSPDGTRILFNRWPSGAIYVVSLDREPQRVCDSCVAGAVGWRDDNHVWLLSTGAAPQFEPRLSALAVESRAATEWIASPTVLTSFRESGVFVESGEPLVWNPQARALYFIGRSRGLASVWKLDINPDTHSLTGGPHRVTTLADDSSDVAIARTTGAMAFAASTRIPQVRWYPLDSTGRRISGPPGVLTSSAIASNYPDMTPDGERIVFTVHHPGGLQGSELRLRTLSEPGDRTLLVSDTGRGEARTNPLISRDGRHVVFRYLPPESLRRGRSGGYQGVQQLRMLDLGTKEESELTRTTSGVVLPHGWSRDGRSVVVTLDRGRLPDEAKGMAIGLLPVAAAPNAESQITIITTSARDLWQPSLSPDGRWLVFRVGSTTDPRQIAVVGSKDGQWTEPQDERSWRYLESDGAAARDKPRWSVDGRQLYYASTRGGLMNVWGVEFDSRGGAFGTPFQVTAFNGPGEQMPPRLEGFGTAVGRGRLVIPTLRPTGGIWFLTPPQ